jgi:hypothetical protein
VRTRNIVLVCYMTSLSSTVVLWSGLSSLPTVVGVSSRTFYILIDPDLDCIDEGYEYVDIHHLGPCWSESYPL